MAAHSKRPSYAARAVLCSLGLSLAASGYAHAQLIPFFANMGPFLNTEDFTFANAAAHTLLAPQPATLGTAIPWNNPASGNSGILTMGRSYERDGHDCREVSWHDLFKDGNQRTLTLDTCNISGVWKLM